MTYIAQDSPDGIGEQRILRRDEVERMIGFKRAHLYNLIKLGKFPRAKRIGLRAVGWDSVEVKRWVAERLGTQE